MRWNPMVTFALCSILSYPCWVWMRKLCCPVVWCQSDLLHSQKKNILTIKMQRHNGVFFCGDISYLSVGFIVYLFCVFCWSRFSILVLSMEAGFIIFRPFSFMFLRQWRRTDFIILSAITRFKVFIGNWILHWLDLQKKKKEGDPVP